MAVLDNSTHELFAQKWHETGNKSEAYRYSHPRARKWKNETVHVKACELSKVDKVKVRHQELKNDAAEAHGVTVESLIEELNEIKGVALTAETPQSSAAVSAVMNKAKLCGLDVIKIESKTSVVDDSGLSW